MWWPDGQRIGAFVDQDWDGIEKVRGKFGVKHVGAHRTKREKAKALFEKCVMEGKRSSRWVVESRSRPGWWCNATIKAATVRARKDGGTCVLAI